MEMSDLIFEIEMAAEGYGVDLDNMTVAECRDLLIQINLDMRTSACDDCHVYMLPVDEYYMVDSETVWSTVADDKTGVLCIGCLEARLGRRLSSSDFPMDIPVNQLILSGEWSASDRLTRRLLDLSDEDKVPSREERKLLNPIQLCPDCVAMPGDQHDENCDVARCSECGGQWISCIEHAEIGEPTFWYGRWPGEQECEEFGLFTAEDSIWGIIPDLNTLYSDPRYVWSSLYQRMVQVDAANESV